MDWFVRAFIRMSLIWFLGGITLGLGMALYPALALYRTVHFHLNLLGFVVQMIYGVALHVIPRFVGQPLVLHRLAGAQFWLAQAGLTLLVLGFALRVPPWWGSELALKAGALLSALAAYFFVANIWTTLGASQLQAVRSRGGRPLPLSPQPQADE
jgi:heme/copper-type cytochrome/quinol oxidase subunit 1